MLDIPEAIKELFKQDGIRKNFRVHFPNGERADLVNKDIVEESVRFTESTCSQQTLRFGLTEASVIEFECVGVENIAGMTIECGIEIDVSSLSREDRLAYGTRTDDVTFPFYAVPYGVFVVDKCPRQADMKRRKVTGYTDIDRANILPLGGWYKKNIIRVGIADLVRLLDGEMTPCSPFYAVQQFRDGLFRKYPEYNVLGYSNAGGNMHEVYLERQGGLGVDRTTSPWFSYNEIVAARMDYTPHIYDQRGEEIYAQYAAALNQVSPAGIYGIKPYYWGIGTPFTVEKNAKTTRFNSLHLLSCRPQIQVVMQKDSLLYFAYPHFVQPGESVLIDLSEEVFEADVTVDNTCSFCLWFSLPYSWGSGRESGGERYSDVIRFVNSSGYIDGISVMWPITEGQTRRGESRAYYRVATKNYRHTLEIPATIKSNFQQIGIAYRYDNAVSQVDAVNGVLEAMGVFGNIQRGGYLKTVTLHKGFPFVMEPSEIESLWYDELETPKIGSVLYKWGDTAEKEEYSYTIDEQGDGVYDLTNNKALELLADKSQSAIISVLRDFANNTKQAYYIPIDMSMRGLPFMEDGDAIQIETPDGEAVNSYILKRTLSGVQHLVDDIEAHGGVG